MNIKYAEIPGRILKWKREDKFHDCRIHKRDSSDVYSGSDAALGRILEKNGIREKVNIATKLPQYLIRNREAIDKYFDEGLSRLKTDYSHQGEAKRGRQSFEASSIQDRNRCCKKIYAVDDLTRADNPYIFY